MGRAWLPQDRRAEPVVARWRQGGAALRVHEISGRPIGPSLRSAQLAWLVGHRPEALDGAVHRVRGQGLRLLLLHRRARHGCRHGCRSVRRLAHGRLRPRVLELLGLEQVARLLPEIVDGTRHHGALTTAAAAASGLLAGTPVVLAPVDTVATALALGLGRRDTAIGGTVLGASNLHMRACDDRAIAASMAGQAAILPFAPAGGWLGVLQQSGTTNVEWLVGSAEQLLRDAGLIGLPHSELGALLERRAAEAAGGGVSYRPFADGGGAAARRFTASRLKPPSTTCCAASTRGWAARRATATPRSASGRARCASTPRRGPARSPMNVSPAVSMRRCSPSAARRRPQPEPPWSPRFRSGNTAT